MTAFDDGEVVAEAGDLFSEYISDRVRPVEIGDAWDVDDRLRAIKRIGNMLFVAVGIRKPKFIQDIGRERGQQLSSTDIGAVFEVGRRIQGIEATHISVERVFITEIVQTDKELLLRADLPIGSQIDELCMLDAGGRCEQIRRDS